jgi:hypothetical protein
MTRLSTSQEETTLKKWRQICKGKSAKGSVGRWASVECQHQKQAKVQSEADA